MLPLPPCPVEITLLIIGNRWKPLIIRDLLDGTKRFGQLRKSIGDISQKVLTANLRELEEQGIVSRQIFAQVPPRVDYSLTKRGKTLEPILNAMAHWGESHRQALAMTRLQD
ncbi:helix-turn-helix transcriptional regulator [Bartonella sp. HY329]|uniref:winged helix-turn-helix transcriptional regulator n=1 Tax=unclassified Bartonella TaxID=2645622 RepID=UPI0021C9AA2A|nr:MULTISPECIES: helix-turn-helix domain-containing protein [unclassified Bartonella]UXM95000.1 helix-turn-helix transcriptional regulator [Bartonella sp. HY329]UXN09323.1 helix-turn-helix transcriptional regulator [Bartonella sp. HY328]